MLVSKHPIPACTVKASTAAFTAPNRNLGDLVGKKICISNPEGNYALPTNTHGGTTTVSTPA